MEAKICQSCGMPITSNDQLGWEKDGTTNEDYCKHCYKDGEFIDKVSMAEYIEMCSQYSEQAGMTNAEMKKHWGRTPLSEGFRPHRNNLLPLQNQGCPA